MTKNEMIKKIEELQELETFIEEIKAEAETIKDSIKAEMLDRDIEELAAGQYIVRWTSILSTPLPSRSSLATFTRALPNRPAAAVSPLAADRQSPLRTAKRPQREKGQNDDLRICAL